MSSTLLAPRGMPSPFASTTDSEVDRTPRSPRSWPRLQAVGLYVAIAGVAFLTNFAFFQKMGLYEDDVFIVARPLNWNFAELRSTIVSNFKDWPQGRPLGWSVGYAFSYFATHVFGMHGAYVVGFCVLYANLLLFYHLLARTVSVRIALLATFLYAVFPADTSKLFIHRCLFSDPAFTLMLLACHLYVRRWPVVPYILFGASLLIYECCAVPFILIPLLALDWNHETLSLKRHVLRRVGRHLLGVGLVLGAIVVTRHAMGESRMTSTFQDVPSAVKKMGMSMALGPYACLYTFYTRIPESIANLRDPIFFSAAGIKRRYVLMAMAASFVLMLYALRRASRPAGDGKGEVAAGESWGIVGKAVVAGLAMMVISYCLSLTRYPPLDVNGRLSSVHIPATIGGSLFIAGLMVGFIKLLAAVRLHFLGQTMVVGYLTALVLFGMVVQRDFSYAWANSKKFWKDLIQTCPDMTENTVVLMRSDDWDSHGERHYYKHAVVNSWAEPFTLKLLFDFPAGWKKPPAVYPVPPKWEEQLIEDKGQLVYKHYVDIPWDLTQARLIPGNTIFLTYNKHHITRSTGSLTLKGREFPLKEPVPGQAFPGELTKLGRLYN